MKYNLFINENNEEKIDIFCKSKTPIVDEIINLCEKESLNIVGIFEDERKLLYLNEIERIYTQNNKTFAVCEKKHFQIKYRLYQIEEMVSSNFIKINQSCIVNLNFISSFKSTFGGTVMVIFKDGEKDFISRRELKHIKERLGI
jgi:DNA-binding LytR/AlgR family response regulator